ncbi:MAG TPA: hypothetical protein PK334_04695 [Bacilli bacterium]|nr:hypothetical protein [Candidatus Paceibacterota bacterium]HPB49582.1 hypothetical protein [Bacilli bacterium]
MKIKNEIRIIADMYYSEAFNSLTRSAIITLMRCLQKRKWKFEGKGRNKKMVYLDEEFIFPYAEAASLGIKTTQHWKNINTLIEVGFLDLAYQGGWYQKHEREKDYSRYKLSDRWRDYGKPEFKKVEKQKVLRNNSYIRENMARQKLKSTSLKRRGQLHKCEDDKPEAAYNRLHKSEVDIADKKTPESLVNSA